MLSSNTSAVSGDANYIENVFSTYLYTGNGSTQSIVNGIDLSTKGGLAWVKNRGAAGGNLFVDSARGVSAGYINSAATTAQSGTAALITALNADGFSVASTANANANTFASWTFRKQPKFFDVVTYTGNGTTQNIAHSLGSTPGCVIVKCTNAAAGWYVWHRGQTAGYYSILNTTAAQTNANNTITFGNNTTYVDPTSTQFTVGSNGNINDAANTYVAYLFAHDAGGFGLTGTDNVISCGSFSTDSGGKATVNLGYEPQMVMFKRTDSSTFGDWYMIDNMRGFTNPSGSSWLWANTSGAEQTGINFAPESTGFNINFTGPANWIYVAIRRGPMKVPTDGTKVFAPVTVSVSAAAYSVNAGFPTDLATIFPRIGGYASISYKWFADRLRGTDLTLSSVSTAAELSISGSVPGCYIKSDNMTGLSVNDTNGSWGGGASQSLISYNFRRAPSFFDEVCYTGTGSANSAKPHNLGVVPELIIIKDRTTVSNWTVYCAYLNGSSSPYNWKLRLNTTAAQNNDSGIFGNQVPTATNFYTAGNNQDVNLSGDNYVAYLFATCAGVSKVGSYTGTGTTQQVDCGFAAGARFVLIKRTDSTGDWYVWDTARGIVSGNDPYLLLNSTAAEVTITDYIDTYSAGFELSTTAAATVNVIGGSYIFLAIA